MRIDAFASLPHLQDHVAAVWCALPDERRGTFWAPSRGLLARAAERGIEGMRGLPRAGDAPIIVANYTDLTECGGDRPTIYVQHGAGQTYSTAPDHESYAGGRFRDRVTLFLEPNETTAALEHARYPEATVRVVGSPYLDTLPAAEKHDDPPVVAFAWHFDLGLRDTPEARSAWPHFRYAVRDLAQSGTYKLLGHGHPRMLPSLRPFYDQWGIEVVPDLADVCRRADLLCVDNSSAGPMFAAATGNPLLWLSAPWYRNDVRHGGRFWKWPAGQEWCAEPEDLAGSVKTALLDFSTAPNARANMVDSVWPRHTRGQAARLAREAIMETFG